MPRRPRHSPESSELAPEGVMRNGTAAEGKREDQSSGIHFDRSDEEYAMDYTSGSEPAATARAMTDSPEGEHLFSDIKKMEYEAMQEPDPVDTLAQTPLAEEIAEVDALLPVPNEIGRASW